MMMHPAHAMLLAETRQRELVNQAEEYRAAGRAAAAGVTLDCRVPTATSRRCQPDPRQAPARPAARRRPSLALLSHHLPTSHRR